jgi:hypothetical protein
MPVTNPIGRRTWDKVATVKRTNTTTGATGTVTTVTGYREPVDYRVTRVGVAPYVDGAFVNDVTDYFFCDKGSDIRANDILTIDGEDFKVRTPRIYDGRLAHMLIPLASFTPL